MKQQIAVIIHQAITANPQSSLIPNELNVPKNSPVNQTQVISQKRRVKKQTGQGSAAIAYKG